MLPTGAFCASKPSLPYPQLALMCLESGDEDKCKEKDQVCKWFDPSTAPTGPVDHCALKAIFAGAAAQSSTAGAGAVCYGI
jgi:hypothetical protein